MISWPPMHYVPVHDHPLGGCMVKLAKGPGVKEIIYEKFNNDVKNEGRMHEEYFCCQHRKREDPHNANKTLGMTGHGNSHGCLIQNFTTQTLQETERFTAMVGNKHEVRTLKGKNKMHVLWNPYNETSYTLSHYLGDFSRITFWFPDDHEFSSKCLSRGDDERIIKSFGNARSVSKQIGKGCDDCAP